MKKQLRLKEKKLMKKQRQTKRKQQLKQNNQKLQAYRKGQDRQKQQVQIKEKLEYTAWKQNQKHRLREKKQNEKEQRLLEVKHTFLN